LSKKLGLDMGTNSLRTLMNTVTDEMLLDNVISAKEKDSVDKINGHSSEVAKTNYKILQRRLDATNSLAIADRLDNSGKINSGNLFCF
jgi:hypothetical protein